MTATQQLALSIQARGEIISSNFPEFAEMVRDHLATFNRDLKSDEDFDQADKDAKAIASAEATLKAAKEKALADAVQLNQLFEQIDSLTGELATARLDLQKQIARRKEEVKAELVEEFLALFDIDPMDARKHYAKPLLDATKSKRTIDSMRAAMKALVTTEQAKIECNRKAIASFESAHGAEMTMDRRELELKSEEYVTGELRRRFEAKKALEEKRRLEAEAAAARKEAEQAKIPGMLPKDDLPKPPKIDSIPVGRVEAKPEPVTEEVEWARWLCRCEEVFQLLKVERAALKHERNIGDAAPFAKAIGQAWIVMKNRQQP